jgi:hypothetical protein
MDQKERTPQPGDGASEKPGAQCSRHPGRHAEARCVDCGRFFCADCVFNWEGDHLCRTCVLAYRPEKPLRTDAEVDREREWSPQQLFTIRLFRTILLSPGKFFESMPRERGIAEPIFFAFSWGLLILVLSAPSHYLTFTVVASNASTLGVMAPRIVEIAQERVDEGFWVFVASAPAHAIVLLTVLLVLASIQHLFLLIMGRRPRFELTMRVAFFSIVAQSLAIIPIPGLSALAAEIYTVVLQAVGFKRVYRLGTAAALFVSVGSALIVQLLQAGAAL